MAEEEVAGMSEMDTDMPAPEAVYAEPEQEVQLTQPGKGNSDSLSEGGPDSPPHIEQTAAPHQPYRSFCWPYKSKAKEEMNSKTDVPGAHLNYQATHALLGHGYGNSLKIAGVKGGSQCSAVILYPEYGQATRIRVAVGRRQGHGVLIPKSRCNDICLPGYRKAFNGGFHVCCYDCVPCSEGEFCNTTDCEICYRCPDEEWPDERRVRCVPKIYDFLSYEKDIVVQISAVTASSFSAITLFILGNFIYYWDTPIVKANNRAVSFILLISILLSFLCVFLFLGRPVDITCRLRQMSFGIFFSTAVSSVLAKTVTVFIAFKATKPGSTWRKWVTLKVSNYVVIVCSSVQTLICGIWLTVYSPYQEYDHHSYKGMIIVQCNEGSVIGLYSMLSYIGILASVNFVLAFMVRTLPDSFNEAKFITFSMLVLCSVWIAMIPAYLSTKGKYMVAVEIFAILTSCAGVLGCIFFPKLYILLIKPEFNSRKTILGKNTL
ncbi:vomeronasal type-2 receptor 26-like [Pseudophryne corroboree]|uniref:vomeronasal type-2 receptor 26-like n=1 Tax=Pseudophryne corroboree TaxID=495146 RepID=UPI00308184AA